MDRRFELKYYMTDYIESAVGQHVKPSQTQINEALRTDGRVMVVLKNGESGIRENGRWRWFV